MIQPHELRVNNYVYFDDEIIQITHLDIFKQPRVQPIPITEDELIKLGFDRTSLHFFKKDGIIICIEDSGFEIFLGNISVILQHTHHLQNLYFALTNKELRYNE